MRFQRFAGFVVVYNLAVILFGAWVRITGSGAGCGEHWPTCNGDVIPRAPALKTIIEYTHRTTSGLCLVFAIVLVAWAYKAFSKGHAVRKASVTVLVFVLLEAAVGAGLVRFGLVDKDESVARAVVIAFHLLNTLGLLAAGGLATYFSAFTIGERQILAPEKKLLFGGVIAILLTSATGAVTALGDTLFPVAASQPAIERWNDLSQGAHFLIRLRIVHPVIAVCAAIYIILVARLSGLRAPDAHAKSTAKVLGGMVQAQILVGFANVTLKAPGYMQIMHLFMANVTWLMLVTLIATRFWPAKPT